MVTQPPGAGGAANSKKPQVADPRRTLDFCDACRLLVVGRLQEASERGLDAQRGEVAAVDGLTREQLRRRRRANQWLKSEILAFVTGPEAQLGVQMVGR
jgi:hypothetical protein